MTNVLAILILSTGFAASVETPDGFVERKFPNTRQGVEEFLSFSEPLVKERKFKICTVTLSEDPGEVMSWLLDAGTGSAFLSVPVYRNYVASTNSNQNSATSVAKACLANYMVGR